MTLGLRSHRWWVKKRDADRARRATELEHQIENRLYVSRIDCAWAAGCFEGEGTATITRSSRHTRGIVSLVNTDASIVEFFATRWPSSMRFVASKNPRHADRWVWCLNSNLSILRFIADIGPFVVTARMRDRLALLEQTQRIRVQGSRDPALRAELEAARVQMARLNRKGPKS